MNNLLTDITVLLDRSGSMNICRSDVIGGLNAFIKKQQEIKSPCKFTLIQFDSMNAQEVIFNAVDIHGLKEFDGFNPRGSTPLLDAFGQAIVKTGARLSAMPESERPGKVIFVVITDGLENASCEFKKPQIAAMVKEQQEKYSWDFVFLGANMDAISEGESLGLSFRNSATFSVNNIGATIGATSAKLANYRVSANKADLNYTVAERESFIDNKTNS